jgi:hypothetical protein
VTFHIKRKKGESPPPSVDDFINAALEKGANAAVRIILKAGQEEKVPLFSEEILNSIGYKFLYFWGRPECARAIFELNVELNPGSANVYDNLNDGSPFPGPVHGMPWFGLASTTN